MQYIVKQVNDRWDNGFYYQEKSFVDICKYFEPFDGEEDEEVDYMIEQIATLNVDESYIHNFFGGNIFMFKRIS